MIYVSGLPTWLRLYTSFLALVLLLVGLVVHVVGSLALASNVNPLAGLAVLVFLWPLTGAIALSVALMWLASALGFWKLGRFFWSLTSFSGSKG